MTTQLLIATTNPGKLREYAAIFADLPYALVTLRDLGVTIDVEETGATFADNAELKARFYADHTGMRALADDSGLCVDALDGAPGVYSARYAGHGASDADRMALLLRNLADVPDAARTARFVCTIAIATPDGACAFVDGVLKGQIGHEPRGDHGFGYDPIFVPRGETRTLAEIPPDEKNAMSHRARAARAARIVLQDAV